MGGFSESAVIEDVVATGMGETLHRHVKKRLQISRVENIGRVFELSGVAFRLVPPYGMLLVINTIGLSCTVWHNAQRGKRQTQTERSE